MVTIYDVAKRAGVSPATVSRVFNGANVSPERAQAVRQAADDLSFVPNRNAMRLRRGSSQIIAMVIPGIENPFFTVMIRAVEELAREHGYSVMLRSTDENPVLERESLRVAVGEPVAGIILAPTRESVFDPAVVRQVPVVCVDRRSPGPLVDSVVADNVGGARAGVQMLFDAGYRRVACVTGPQEIETAVDRAEGWRRATLDTLGHGPDPQILVETDFSVTAAEAATYALLDLPTPPDAIFAANNRIAAGVIRGLAARGLLPPRMGVVAFGGLPLVVLRPRGIMVTHLPAREIVLTATRMLLERIGGFDGPPRDVVLPVVLGDDDSGLTLEGF